MAEENFVGRTVAVTGHRTLENVNEGRLEEIFKYMTEVNPEVKKLLSDTESYLLQ